MQEYEFVIEGVSRTAYDILKGEGQKILTQTKNGLNDFWKPRVKDIELTFKYNPSRGVIGIYLIREGREDLILDSTGLTTEEMTLAICLHRTLSDRLDQMLDKKRIVSEEWV